MAFSDDGHRFWHVDLTTRVGATTAASMGATACFVFCGLCVLRMFLFGGIAGFGTAEGIATMGGAALEGVLGLIAGLRLRAGLGAYWGGAVAVLLTLEVLLSLVSLSLGGAVVSGIFLVLITQGARGALALKNTKYFEDDHSEYLSRRG